MVRNRELQRVLLERREAQVERAEWLDRAGVVLFGAILAAPALLGIRLAVGIVFGV